MQDRAEIVHNNFLTRVKSGDLPATKTQLKDSGLTAAQAVEIFESQCLSRQLDNTSRKLQARGEGFYTIGSSGHEGNAAIAAACRRTDMAFLHYRDAAFFIQRSKQLPGSTPLWDMLLSFTTAKEDPISGGRHKVLGSKDLFIPPQTSTIASHLPKAVGAAHSIGINKRLNRTGTPLPEDSIILCSFGDASLNHSTAQGAINTAGWTSYQAVPLPLMFVCEDNGIGISVPTPPDWVKASISQRPGIKYFAANGLDIFDTFRAANEAQDYIRRTRKPAFLHMRCVRLFGHAGPDAQHMYLSEQQITAMEANDPLLHTAALLINDNILSAEQILTLYNGIGTRVERAAEQAIKRPKMSTAEEVMASIIPPPRPSLSLQGEGNEASPQSGGSKVGEGLTRDQLFADDAALMKQPQHMAKLLSWTLADLMLENPNMVAAGEDVGRKGGVYTVTQKLQQRFGAHRVIDTLLDEQSILGLGIGMAHNDILPVPEIQFLAYVHNAEDQIRGEAATLSFFSSGQYTNPMVVRIAGLGYQKGFGGHFHNDNSIAALRDIPGIIIACPSGGADASAMLRECIRLAREQQRVVIFLEPIALYMTRDLHEPKDNLWASTYDPANQIALGEIGQHGDGTDLCIISYANGHYLARQAAKDLEERHNIKTRVLDIRWLNPVNIDAITAAAKPCKNILIVDECRTTGSLAHELYTKLSQTLPDHNLLPLCAEDSFIPLGRVATVTMPGKESIVEKAVGLVNGKAKVRKTA
ncbi:MAG: MFS transporter [Rhodospirillales bacterium]|nr:MFS transporter [Rhodospirillales bacterium]MCB9995233.1 MFS transporter [Rhodospirillales bacterium]